MRMEVDVKDSHPALVPMGRMCDRCLEPGVQEHITEDNLYEERCYRCSHTVPVLTKGFLKNRSASTPLTRGTLYVLRYGGQSSKLRDTSIHIQYKGTGFKNRLILDVPFCYSCGREMLSIEEYTNKAVVSCILWHTIILWREEALSPFICWTLNDMLDARIVSGKMKAAEHRRQGGALSAVH